jgi:hypothetical protein
VNEEHFAGAWCGEYNSPLGGLPTRSIRAIVPAPDGSYYIHGQYWGYHDGTTHHPEQRFVSRLHGLDLGVREQEQLQLEVFPNPSMGQFTIQLDRFSGSDEMEVRDALGRTVLQQHLTSASMELDLSQQADGLYTIALRSKADVPMVRRVVIQR